MHGIDIDYEKTIIPSVNIRFVKGLNLVCTLKYLCTILYDALSCGYSIR